MSSPDGGAIRATTNPRPFRSRDRSAQRGQRCAASRKRRAGSRSRLRKLGRWGDLDRFGAELVLGAPGARSPLDLWYGSAMGRQDAGVTDPVMEGVPTDYAQLEVSEYGLDWGDVSQIRDELKLTPTERLKAAQDLMNAVIRIRAQNGCRNPGC
ncbi:MAG TPA: hypothetical protein VGS22_06890 [Thermoanaerobaculia bacterium]|jgi:hypothetical protein|nr:hypothetical protein [Thermoanaerobaculia bacterium]